MLPICNLKVLVVLLLIYANAWQVKSIAPLLEGKKPPCGSVVGLTFPRREKAGGCRMKKR